ncbi:(2Fe-2S) ferredoxin domain-containing protein [Geofilum rubicundum]|uniref:NAD-reducing hydrogenase subunit HoxF n=1 Tax=Geofilum rubicundum JCM 15548 TaxID=1236989 RepID=A0A0E9LXT6_9BACT|nr:NAD(P)H-dependent oxidoreductase subunit E [Geofilum rubicundum]GAO30118.1 NAD-reducing hydrogenase subunit HoxF [Geofilum rubicundum JCM 15548]
MGKFKSHILVCGGTGCRASRGEEIVENLQAALQENGLHKEVQVVRTGCFGFCEKGPVVKMVPDNTFYVHVEPEDASELVLEHMVKGRKVERLLYLDPETKERISDSKHMGFYKKQYRIALRNCGFINPENIDEYIARDGYAALGKALVDMQPDAVIQMIKASGLRGRGGGGFPTGLKWELTRKSVADQKYVVCNADEGDPGAFMDRSILEGDPHSVLEAMAICGYCIGADTGLIYIRAEYPLAIQRLKTAIDQARDYGVLGNDIFGTGFNFDVEIRYGAGAFVCGEETALIHSMEGLRGEPTVKPPFPAERGYKDKPTNVNNVETLANIAPILLKGSECSVRSVMKRAKEPRFLPWPGRSTMWGLLRYPWALPCAKLFLILAEVSKAAKSSRPCRRVDLRGAA